MKHDRLTPVSPTRKLYRHCCYELNRLRRNLAARWRKEWPANPAPESATRPPRAAIIVASYNTAQLLSYLIYSLHRVLGPAQFTDIVVVDNCSTDGSRDLLAALGQARLVTPILNTTQRYHGPALNQAVDHLIAKYRNRPSAERPNFILTLDSDIVVLRPELLRDAVAAMRAGGAVLCGQYESNVVVDGYAHISCMLMDPSQVWRRGIPRFENEGTPAQHLQRGLENHGHRRLNFPFRTNGYVLHFGRGTLREVFLGNDQANEYFQWAVKTHDYDALRDPFYRRLFEEFHAAYSTEVDGTPAGLVSACQKPTRLTFRRPTEYDYLRYHRDVKLGPDDAVIEADCIKAGWLPSQ